MGLKVNKELIGNIMILLAEQCKPLYHTKLLKLLYLIDEEAVKYSGAPITWLDYKVWQHGPVTESVYYSKNKGENKFNDYVKFKQVGTTNKHIIKPVAELYDGLFSDFDMEVIERTIAEFGDKTSEELVEITHKNGSLWDKLRTRHGITFSKDNGTSEVSMDFQELLSEDKLLRGVYQEAREMMYLKMSLQ